MISSESRVRELVDQGLDRIMGKPGVVNAELFAGDNLVDGFKMNFTSNIPCNAGEQPTSEAKSGVSVRLLIDDGKYGTGSESGLDLDSVDTAYAKAVMSAHVNPFISELPLPVPQSSEVSSHHDSKVFDSRRGLFIDLGYEALEGAVDAFREGGFTPDSNIVFNGDVTIIREAMAVASSMGIRASETSTILSCFLTAMLQREDAKGTGWNTGSHLDGFDPKNIGRIAALSAINTVGGKRVPSGNYDVVLGPQAVTDVAHNFLIPGFGAENFAVGYTPFVGKFGRSIASSKVDIYDDPTIPGLGGSKSFNCEGLPTQRTVLVRNGDLVGLLSANETASLWSSNSQDSRITDYHNKLRRQLGTDEIPRLAGRNGFRFGKGGGRVHMSGISAHSTNLFIGGNEVVPESSLIDGSVLQDGLLIGRLWYLYPTNGPPAGDITGNVIASSYVVRDGKIVNPLSPNTLRLNDNFCRMLGNVSAVGDKTYGTVVWGSEGIVHAPYMMIRDVHFDSIAG